MKKLLLIILLCGSMAMAAPTVTIHVNSAVATKPVPPKPPTPPRPVPPRPVPPTPPRPVPVPIPIPCPYPIYPPAPYPVPVPEPYPVPVPEPYPVPYPVPAPTPNPLIIPNPYVARPSVVRVEAVEHRMSSLGSGTCIATTNQSLIITAWHVVRDGYEFKVNGLPAKVIATNKTWDLAVLVIDQRFSVSQLSDVAPRIGDRLTVCGFGSGDYREVTGTIQHFFSPGGREPNDIVAMDAAARSGDSGGPLFKPDGTLGAVLFGSDSLGAHGSHCLRVRWFIETIRGYDELKREALKPVEHLLYAPAR